MVFCTNCGARITEGEVFCTNCGKAVQTDENANAAPVQPAIPVQDDNVFCTNCGEKIEEDTLFCTKCGAKVGTDSFGQQPIPQAYSIPNSIPPKKKVPLGVILAAAGVVVVLIIIAIAVSLNDQPNYPSYTSGTGTVSPPPSASATASSGTATAPKPSAPAPSTGETATAPAPPSPQSPSPAQSSKAVDLWQTERVPVAKSEMYKLCDRFKYYETESYYGKSNFIKKYGNDLEWVYDVDSPYIFAVENGEEVGVMGINREEVFLVTFTNTNNNSYRTRDSRDKTGIDGVLVGFDW